MLKVYKIENYANNWTCTVELNEDFVIMELSAPDNPVNTLKIIEQVIRFWTGAQKRIEQNEGNISKTFLQQLGREIFLLKLRDNFTTKNLIDKFLELEGWIPMDGSYGIKITDVDEIEIYHTDFEIERVN
jgi:hypothetical protein